MFKDNNQDTTTTSTLTVKASEQREQCFYC